MARSVLKSYATKRTPQVTKTTQLRLFTLSSAYITDCDQEGPEAADLRGAASFRYPTDMSGREWDSCGEFTNYDQGSEASRAVRGYIDLSRILPRHWENHFPDWYNTVKKRLTMQLI